jgi:hypothetical protein
MQDPAHHPDNLQLEDLINDEVLLVVGLTPHFLLDGLGYRICRHLILDLVPGYPGQTTWVPGKDVGIFPKENNKFFLLLRR